MLLAEQRSNAEEQPGAQELRQRALAERRREAAEPEARSNGARVEA